MIPTLVTKIPASAASGLKLGDELSLPWPEGVRGFRINKITMCEDGTATIEAGPVVDQHGRPFPLRQQLGNGKQ